MEDHKIIKGCKKREPRYQKMLLTKYAPMLMAVAMRYMKREDLAKDILQESWIKIFNAIDRYEDHKKLKGWLKTIVINTALSALRGKQATIIPIESYHSNSVESSDNIESRLNMEDLMDIIYDIPSPAKEVFMMNVIDGMSHKEIGKHMGITDSTSRVHLTNARKYLRKVFAESKELKAWIGKI